MTDAEVITAAGTAGGWGCGLDDVQHRLATGRAHTEPLADPEGYRRRGAPTLVVRRADLDLSPWLEPSRARRMSDPSRLAVAAARMAVAAANLPTTPDGRGAQRLGVCLATSFGAGVFTERLMREIVEVGPRTVSPFLFTDCVANAPAAQVAIDLGASGPNSTICQRQAGPLLALIDGVRLLRAGRCDSCLVGAVDEIGALVHAVLDRMGDLCAADDDGVVRPRPFAPGRQGYLPGEGATVLLLERESAARRRQAPILARVAGFHRGFDPTASRSGWGVAGAAVAARALPALDLRRIDGIVSGASGSRQGDRAEAAALRGLFAGGLPPVFVPKAVVGEYGGGTLAPALVLLRGASAARPEGCEEPDPDLGVIVHDGALAARSPRILLTELASGGAAAFVVLETAD